MILHKLACAISKDSDQPAHSRMLIRVFAVRLETLWILGYPQCPAKNDQTARMADLSHRWTYMESCRKCCAPAHIKYWNSLRKHAYSKILKKLPPKNENFQIKKPLIFFIFLLKT